MFDIESVADKMVIIDGTYIPAVNIQIEGYPCVLDGHEYPQYFEVIWEYENYHWEVSKGVSPVIQVDIRGYKNCLFDVLYFGSWIEFRDALEPFRTGLIGGRVLKHHVENR